MPRMFAEYFRLKKNVILAIQPLRGWLSYLSFMHALHIFLLLRVKTLSIHIGRSYGTY